MMKKRRAPVQSVLAERKMFAGGGMLPISRPMEEKQPSGILASSEPLIDAVAQEVLAPMTGGPLTMAEGGSVMRQSISSNLPRASGMSRPRFPINFNPYGGGVLSELESLSDEMGEGLSDIGARIEGVGDYADKAADRLGQSFGRQLDNYANTVQGQLGTEGYTNPFSRFFGRQGLAGLLGEAQTQAVNRLEPQVTPQPKPEPDQLSNGFLPTPQRMNQGGIAKLNVGGMGVPGRKPTGRDMGFDTRLSAGRVQDDIARLTAALVREGYSESAARQEAVRLVGQVLGQVEGQSPQAPETVAENVIRVSDVPTDLDDLRRRNDARVARDRVFEVDAARTLDRTNPADIGSFDADTRVSDSVGQQGPPFG